MEKSTFTAPKAYIKIGNEVAGFIRNLSWSENISRGNVRGLGSLNNQEAPAIAIDCQWQCDQFFIDLSRGALPKLLNRVSGANELLNTLSLGEFSFDIAIYRKTITGKNDVDRLVTSVDNAGETVCVLQQCFTTNQSFQLGEGQIAGFNVSGVYLIPVTIGNQG